MAAIGAMYEGSWTGTANLDQTQDAKTHFALEQCNMAIQHLVEPNVCRTLIILTAIYALKRPPFPSTNTY